MSEDERPKGPDSPQQTIEKAIGECRPADSAPRVCTNILYVLEAQKARMEKDVWDTRLTDERYRDMRAAYHQLEKDIEIVANLRRVQMGLRPLEKPIPTVRKPTSAYGER